MLPRKLTLAGTMPHSRLSIHLRSGQPTCSAIMLLLNKLLLPFWQLDCCSTQSETCMQVTLDVMAWDGKSDLEVLALTAALAALRNANLPIGTCPGVARVSRIQGSLVTNPTAQQQAGADLSLLYAGAGSTANLVHMQVGYAGSGAFAVPLQYAWALQLVMHGQRMSLWSESLAVMYNISLDGAPHAHMARHAVMQPACVSSRQDVSDRMHVMVM